LTKECKNYTILKHTAALTGEKRVVYYIGSSDSCIMKPLKTTPYFIEVSLYAKHV